MNIPFGQSLITALMDAAPNGLTVAELVPHYSSNRKPAQDVPEAVRRELGRQRIKLSFKGLALEYDNVGHSRTGPWTVYRIVRARKAASVPLEPTVVPLTPAITCSIRSVQRRTEAGAIVSVAYVPGLDEQVQA